MVCSKSSQAVMQEAVNLQGKHTSENEDWLKGLGLGKAVEDEILVRMVQDGGDWLSFVQALTGYKGDFSVLT